MPYAVDDEVQLVCKYLNAYKITQAGNPNDKGIDRLFKEGNVHTTICISWFSCYSETPSSGFDILQEGVYPREFLEKE